MHNPDGQQYAAHMSSQLSSLDMEDEYEDLLIDNAISVCDTLTGLLGPTTSGDPFILQAAAPQDKYAPSLASSSEDMDFALPYNGQI